MRRATLWVVNAGLLVLAVAVTAWVVGQTPAPGDPAGRNEAKASRADRKSERKGALKEHAGTSSHEAASAADFDVLWQQTLFRPERTEELSESSSEDAAAASAALNLELVGLARIGERAVAVIVQHRGQTVRRTLPTGTAVAVGLVRPVPRAPVTSAAASPEVPEGPPDRHVYKVGDKVGDSGYSLKEIRFTEKEVVLVRGSEERVLKLETNDDQSTSRRETAATAPPAPKPPAEAPAAAKTTAEAAVAAGGAPPSLPPPPPVAAGVPSLRAATSGVDGAAARETPGVTPMSREERLERARLLRERILQGRPPSGASH